MKKIYFLFLMTLLPLLASAETKKINGINYNVDPETKTAQVISGGDYTGNIVIPQTITFKSIECKVTSIGDNAFQNCGLFSVTIPNSVISIGNNAFRYCSFLTTVTIGNGVTSIGGSAFYNCSSLTTVTIGNSVTTIGWGAFEGCTALTSISIPNSVTTIGGWAFAKSGLTSITIPNSVTTIGGDAFNDTPWYNNKPDGIVYAGKVLYKYKGTMPSGTKIRVKNGTLGIANYAFSDCSGLTSIDIPNSVTTIDGWAFLNSGLTSVTIPNSVTSIGYNVFANCSKLTSIKVASGNTVYDSRDNCNAIIEKSSNQLIMGCKNTTIPNSVTSIGNGAFYECSGLTSVNIPNSVTTIGGGAFYDCSSLTSVNIPNSVTTIGDGAFYDCSSLTSVTIPNSVTSIGQEAFYKCSSLTSITIPNSVTRIEGYTFQYCNSLATVILGNGINYIGYYSFADCGQLTDFYCFAENVPSTSFSPFQDFNIGNATLHVPAGSLGPYKAKSPWSGFKDVVVIETVKVKLNKTKVTLEKGKTVTLKATITPSTFPDKSVTWKSSNKKIATVTSSGKVKAIKAGTATITCTSEITGEKATCKVTVFEGSVTLDKTEVTLQKGKTVTLKATVEPTTLEDKSVTWTSSNTKVATVTTAGKVKGVKAGTATITCTSNATGMSATCKVTVINGTVTLNKTEAIIEKGKTTTLKATLTPTTLEDMSVTWTSSDKSIATVTSKGKVKGVGYGTATITCTSNATGVSATCQVTVGKVVISMSEFSIKKSRTNVLTATVYPSTLSDKSVTWTSSDTKVATVTSSGKVKGIAAGTATITCTSVATGLKGTCTVTVLATSESRSVEGDDDTTGIENLEEAPALAEPYDVYDLSGRKVLNQTTTLDGLPAGIYIVNGKKVLKK